MKKNELLGILLIVVGIGTFTINLATFINVFYIPRPFFWEGFFRNGKMIIPLLINVLMIIVGYRLQKTK